MNGIHLNRIDLNLLDVFDAVAATGSTTLAAERLALSQSAVSHALNRLRDVIGDPLFVRGRHGLVMTAHAARLAPGVHILLQQARGILARAVFEPHVSTRSFRLGASDYAMLTIVPGLVKILRKLVPQAMIEIVAINEDALSLLENGSLDIAFMGAALPASPILAYELFRERFVGLISAHYAGGVPISLQDYLALPHAIVTFQDAHQSPVDEALAKLGHKRQVGLVAPHFAAHIEALSDTDLVMSLPARLADRILHPGLVPFELPFSVPAYPYLMLWHRRSESDPACVWLRQQVKEACATRCDGNCPQL